MAKRKRKARPDADFGPIERQQHAEYVTEQSDLAGVKRQRNVTHDVLATYERRNQITTRQKDAGEAFANSWRKGMLAEVYSTIDLEGVIAIGGDDYTGQEAVYNARQSVHQMVRLLGKPLSDLVIHVCGLGHHAGSWPPLEGARSGEAGMSMLRLSLDQMAHFYRV